MENGEVRLVVKVESLDAQDKATLVYSTEKMFGAAKVKAATEQALVYETLGLALSGAGNNPNVIKPFKPSPVAGPPTPVAVVKETPKASPPPSPSPNPPEPSPVPSPKPSSASASKGSRSASSKSKTSKTEG